MAKKMNHKVATEPTVILDEGVVDLPMFNPAIDFTDATASSTGHSREALHEPTVSEESAESQAERRKQVVAIYAEEVTDSQNPLYHEHVLAWYVKNQIQASPLPPAEIAQQAGVSTSQIYRFLKGERSLTLESADRLLPVVGRSLVEKIRGIQAQQRSTEVSPESINQEIVDEKERLRQRLDKWEKTAYTEANEIMKGIAVMADRMRAMINEL